MAKKRASKSQANTTRRVVKHSKSKVSKVGGKTVAVAAAPKGMAKLHPKHVRKVLFGKKALKIYGITAAIGVLAVAGIFLWFAKDLPSPNKINEIASAQTTKLYDRTGKTQLVEIYGDKNRSIIEFDQMPKCIKDATVALEDKDFYKQGAFSPAGIGRALTGVIFKDPTKGGGSTITQQYVKNALLTNEPSYSRKIKELILAIEIEQLYKKDDILKLYLNEIPYGSTAYGIEAAAKQYYGIDAKNLNLAQCAMLASIPQAPTYYSPYGLHTDALIGKKDHVLDIMAQQGYISQAEADTAKKEDVLGELKPYNPYANVTAPHFVQYVRDQLEEQYGVKRVNEGGFKVITTIDLDKQKLAEQSVSDNMNSVRSYGGSNAALVSADPQTGQVLSMVGSYDPKDPDFGSFNVAAARRQPGSSIKPIVYSNLFKKNWGPGSTIYDVTTDFGGYKPKNYTNRTYGVQSIRTAFASSLNIPAVKALYLGGETEFLGTAKDMGITTFDRSPDEYGLSLALGSGEVRMVDMANAFSVLADEGQKHKPVYWLKITDSKGKTIEDNTKGDANKPKQVLDPQIAYEVSSIMSDNSARCSLGVFTCNNPLTLSGRPVAAKTGTTEDYKDAWTVGYTPQVVTVVWAGNNNNKPMTQAASIVSAPIWHQYMQEVTKNDPVIQFKQPKEIKKETIDANTGKSPLPGSKTRSDIFASWYKVPQADAAQKALIDTVSGKLATDCTPQAAKKEITGALMTAEVASTDPAYPKWNPPVQALARSLGYAAGGAVPTEKDDVHQCGDPSPTVSVNVSPASGSTFTITANVNAGKFPITQVIFYMDGNQIGTQSGNASQYSISSTPPAGNHSFSAYVQDEAYYSGTSNSVTVTATGAGGGNLSCVNTPPNSSCTFTYTLGAFTASLVASGGASVNSGANPQSSSPASWTVHNWNGVAGPSSNVKVNYITSGGGGTVYP